MLVGLLFVTALTTAGAHQGLVAQVQSHAPAVKRWSGALLIVAGGWFLTLAAFADFFADLFPV